MDIYLIRHGLTYWNKSCKMQGQVNIPLCQEGKEQAKRAAEKFSDVPIEVCYSSPLSRAIETAEIFLQGREIPIIPNELLLEQGYGVLEGASQRLHFHIPGFRLYNYLRHPEKYRAAIGGEEYQEVFRRAHQFCNEVLKPAEKSISSLLVSSHGAFLAVLLCVMRGLSVEDFLSQTFEHCEVKKVIMKDGLFSL